MSQNFHIGQLKIPYKVNKSSDRANLRLVMDNSLELEIKAPNSISNSQIEKTLNNKKNWILKQINDFSKQKEAPKDKEYLSGEKLLYNGRRYYLKVFKNKNPEFYFNKGKFYLEIPDFKNQNKRREKCKKIIKNWYIDKAKENLSRRTRKYSSDMNVNPKEVKIKNLNKKWGKHKKGELKFHWKLVLAPIQIQDYVIVHELAHIKEDNHSENFWNIVGSIIPNYEERIQWLKVNGNILSI